MKNLKNTGALSLTVLALPALALFTLILFTLALLTLTLLTTSKAQAESFSDAITDVFVEGDISLNLRYRYEFVDQDGIDKDAGASTLRSRVTLTSGKLGNFQALVEVDNVSYLGGDTFNNTENGETSRPVVADPDYTDINQAYLSYFFNQKNTVSVGRQRINHGGQRFLGGVAWRQNEQTFDAARLQLSPSDRLKLDYSYIWGVNRIFGPEGPLGNAEFEGQSHAALAHYTINDQHSLSGFAYLLDLEGGDLNSSHTYGLEYLGNIQVNDALKLGVNLSYAKQSSAEDNPIDYDADYYFAELSATFKPLSIAMGQEALGSDKGIKGFSTPLATGHKFQGFADKFLATPANGVKDSYLKVVSNISGVKLVLFYHDFDSEENSMDYGSEIDFVASYSFKENYQILFKYAAYNADEYKTDTDKAWLMISAAF